MNGSNYANQAQQGYGANTLSGGYALGPCETGNQCDKAAAPVSQAETLLNELRYTQDDTASLLAQLAQSAAFAPQSPQADGNKAGAVYAATSPLCDELGARLSTQHRLNGTLRDLLDRLTV